jgi:hypothetical protein
MGTDPSGDTHNPAEHDPELKSKDLLWNKIAPLADDPDAPRVGEL